jgi:hypothetical protein
MLQGVKIVRRSDGGYTLVLRCVVCEGPVGPRWTIAPSHHRAPEAWRRGSCVIKIVATAACGPCWGVGIWGCCGLTPWRNSSRWC